jgi:NAD-dependent deacetylase sirtuin 7
MLKKGIKIETPDFSSVKPTYSHMLLKRLLDLDMIKHIVSQNCDGLHFRSGIDRNKLSELHGNCFIEQCRLCDNREYVRQFDVTENTKFRKHTTNRYCRDCKQELSDTIIHFGEKLLPYNWDEARDAVKKADCIICLGSSLKVLQHYTWLWPKDLKKSVQLCILNIQWTSKDKFAKLKINAYCDDAMKLVAKHLNIVDVKEYQEDRDPLIATATQLDEEELKALKKPTIQSSCQVESSNSNNWYIRSFKK